jgi:GT2 family glycosyltransferase
VISQVILVNYHCADLICEAVASLGDIRDLQVDVVDNSASADQENVLRSSLPKEVRLLLPGKNLGFGQACNLAFQSSRSEFVLLLNPDARLMPGALDAMVAELRADTRLAAVGPRVYWDEERRFMMPLSTFPSKSWLLRSCFGTLLPVLNVLGARSFRRAGLAAWRASRPVPVEALSGGHVLLRRSAVVAAGGLFDPDFFMYWEDSDLMHRLKMKGFRLALIPKAEALHFYSHSPAKERLIHAGWQVYSHKHHHSLFWRFALALKQRFQGRNSIGGGFASLDWNSGGVSLPVPESLDDWLLEISPSPDFVPAIGCLGSGRDLVVPLALLRAFSGCDIYLRLAAPSPAMGHARTWVLKVP